MIFRSCSSRRHEQKSAFKQLSFGYDRLFVGSQMLKRFPRPHSDAIRRVFGELRLDARATEDEFGEIAQLRGAASHDDAVVDDVGRELGRRFLKHVFDSAYHGAKLFADSAHDLIGAKLNRARQPREMIATLHDTGEILIARPGGADADFTFFSSL